MKTGKSAVWILLVVSLGANAALAVGLFDLRKDLDSSAELIDERAAEAEQEIEDIASETLEQIPTLDEVEGDIEELRSTLFGFSGPSPGQRDLIGQIQRDVRQLETEGVFDSGDYEYLQSCFNRALSNSFNSFERYVFNESAFSYTVSSC